MEHRHHAPPRPPRWRSEFTRGVTRYLVVLGAGIVLASAALGQAPSVQLALNHIEANAKQLNLEPADLPGLELVNHHVSAPTGISHFYFQQHSGGVPLHRGIVSVAVARDGTPLHSTSRAHPGLAATAAARTVGIDAQQAIQLAADAVGLQPTETIGRVATRQDVSAAFRPVELYSRGGIALEEIQSRLVFTRDEDGLIRLAWLVEIYQTDAQHYWSVAVDAASGEIVSVDDLVVHDHWGDESLISRAPLARTSQQPSLLDVATLGTRASFPWSFTGVPDGSSYRVYGPFVESPIHTHPQPPADGRVLIHEPAHPVASPFGWHDTNGAAGPEFTVTRGNNVHAYSDHNNSGTPDVGGDPDGGPGLTFDFPIDLTQHPHTYRDAAVANLFYWNNITHDIAYVYGFTEAAGNFQVNNYGRGGQGNDDVRAEAQDGGGTNNANFLTPVDGSRPRMQMYLWNTADPFLDGDLDAGIIVHEYAHGISHRLTGGPATVSCLSNQEQMGEGWSDYYGLVFTDHNMETRGIGTYALNEPTTGQGIRPAPYSRDFAINDFTYGRIGTLARPHGVGFLWATMLWDMTRDLVDLYGFNPDVFAPWHTGGNNMAIQLVTEGMKLQPCSPGFVDGRDAILAAEQALTGGANQCAIWESFARRGLGYSADQGSTNSSSDGTEAFDLHPACFVSVAKEADPSPVNDHATVGYALTITNNTDETATGVHIEDILPENATYVDGSASDGGTFNAGKITWPAISLAVGESVVRTYQLIADAGMGSEIAFEDDVESGNAGWSATHGAGDRDWAITSARSLSPSNSWFAQNVAYITDQYLALADPFEVGSATELRFWHSFGLETGFDGGVIEISLDGGASWTDLGSRIVQNGYTHALSAGFGNPLGGRQAFSGNSGWIETVVDLSDLAGETVKVRFRLGTDSSISRDGWYIDDVFIGFGVNLVNQACVSADGLSTHCVTLSTPVLPALDAPIIEVSEKPIVLWPPNHDYHRIPVADFVTAVSSEIDADVAIEDVVITHITSDEPENGDNDGNTFDDILIVGDCKLAVVRAERDGLGNGRVYRIHVALTDAMGGTGTASFPVQVPLSNRPGNVAVEDAPQYTVVSECAGAGSSLAGRDAQSDAAARGVDDVMEYALEAAFPNPLATSATVGYALPEATRVRISVYDVLGREVVRLADDHMEAGRYSLTLDGSDLASGVYILRMSVSNGFVQTQRITVMR